VVLAGEDVLHEAARGDLEPADLSEYLGRDHGTSIVSKTLRTMSSEVFSSASAS
jgi:hypothetical protein